MKPIEPGCKAITVPPWAGELGHSVIVHAVAGPADYDMYQVQYKPEHTAWITSGAKNVRGEIQEIIWDRCLMRIDGHEPEEDDTEHDKEKENAGTNRQPVSVQ